MHYCVNSADIKFLEANNYATILSMMTSMYFSGKSSNEIFFEDPDNQLI